MTHHHRGRRSARASTRTASGPTICEAGSGEQTVVLMHGSGPGVTAYSNWRLVLPALGEDFHVVAPDMVGFGFSDRPEDVEYSAADLGRPDRRLHRRARHREGPPGRQQLRRRHRAADRHRAPRPGRQAGADGQHGCAASRSPRASDRSGATSGRSRTCARCSTSSPTRAIWSTRSWPRSGTRRSMEPGFQESFSSMFPAPRQRWVDAMVTPDEEIRKLPHRTLIVHGREDKVIPVENSLPARGADRQRRSAGVLALRALVDDRAHRRLQPAGPRLLPRQTDQAA